MSATWYANIGSDGSPNWQIITDTNCVHFTGLGSTAGVARSVLRPSSGFNYNDEIWIAPAAFAGGVKVNNYVKPSALTQHGKVFKIVFSEDLVAAPVITAYDDVVDGVTLSTYAKEMLAGTEKTNWTSMIKCFCTNKESSNVPPAAGWAIHTTGRAGSANPNSLQGSSQFVTVPFIPAAGGDFTFTLAVTVPEDADAGKADKYDPVLTVIYVTV